MPAVPRHAQLLSVNVGASREVEWRGEPVRTGIWKAPIGDRPVRVAGVNVAGDEQADREVHGGRDKAVYAYAIEDYEYWLASGLADAAPALFGENLTVRGFDLRAAVAGERWRVGSVVLEVTQPRLPCFKLGMRVGDARFPKRFLAAGRLGAYLRIVEPGELRAGDAVALLERPAHGVTLARMASGLSDAALARELLSVTTLAPGWRAMLARRATSDDAARS